MCCQHVRGTLPIEVPVYIWNTPQACRGARWRRTVETFTAIIICDRSAHQLDNAALNAEMRRCSPLRREVPISGASFSYGRWRTTVLEQGHRGLRIARP